MLPPRFPDGIEAGPHSMRKSEKLVVALRRARPLPYSDRHPPNRRQENWHALQPDIRRPGHRLDRSLRSDGRTLDPDGRTFEPDRPVLRRSGHFARHAADADQIGCTPWWERMRSKQ